MLASETWMIVHVAVSAIQSRILRGLSINLEDVLDPLHVHQLLLRRKLICLLDWTLLDIIVRIEKVIAGIKISNIFLWKTFLCWIWTICRIDWNRLMSLGRASSSRPFGSTLAFLPCPYILGGLRGFGEPFVEVLNSLPPKWMIMES